MQFQTTFNQCSKRTAREKGSRNKEHRANALAPGADEGRDKLRKATFRSTYPIETWVSEWGNPADGRSVTVS